MKICRDHNAFVIYETSTCPYCDDSNRYRLARLKFTQVWDETLCALENVCEENRALKKELSVLKGEEVQRESC